MILFCVIKYGVSFCWCNVRKTQYIERNQIYLRYIVIQLQKKWDDYVIVM